MDGSHEILMEIFRWRKYKWKLNFSPDLRQLRNWCLSSHTGAVYMYVVLVQCPQKKNEYAKRLWLESTVHMSHLFVWIASPILSTSLTLNTELKRWSSHQDYNFCIFEKCQNKYSNLLNLACSNCLLYYYSNYTVTISGRIKVLDPTWQHASVQNWWWYYGCGFII